MSNVGTKVLLKLGTVFCVGESSTSFKSAQTMIETSSKQSGNNSTFSAGRINQTMSVSSIASTDPAATSYGLKQALDKQAAGTEEDVLITEYTDETGASAVSGALKLSAKCLFSNISAEFPDNDKMTFSLDIQITDGTTVGTN